MTPPNRSGARRQVPPRPATLSALVLLLASQTAAKAYFVDDVLGSDSATGLSRIHAWKTTKAVDARSFRAGDSILFRPGGAWSGAFFVRGSGEPGKSIVVAPWAEGAAPVLRHPGVEWGRILSIAGSHVVVDGLRFEDAVEAGVYLEKTATEDTVRRCTFTRLGFGVEVAGRRNALLGNTAVDLRMVRNTPCDPVAPQSCDDDYGAVAFALFNGPNEVAGNTCRGCRDSSFDYGMDGGMVEIYAAKSISQRVDSCLIHHNFATSGEGFLEIGGESGTSVTGTVVSRNISWNNRGTFAFFHVSGTFGTALRGLRIEHNTVVEHLPGSRWILGYDGTIDTSVLALRNNIFSTDGDGILYVLGASTWSHDHNLYWRADGSPDVGFPLGTGELLADPLFIDAAAGDFRLRPESPARDAGIGPGSFPDFAGLPLAGKMPDLGAWEAQDPQGLPAPGKQRQPSPFHARLKAGRLEIASPSWPAPGRIDLVLRTLHGAILWTGASSAGPGRRLVVIDPAPLPQGLLLLECVGRTPEGMVERRTVPVLRLP